MKKTMFLEKGVYYLVPLLWSVAGTLLILLLWQNWIRVRRPYLQLSKVVERGHAKGEEKRDSRGLVRMIEASKAYASIHKKMKGKYHRKLALMDFTFSEEEILWNNLGTAFLGAMPLMAVPVLTQQILFIVLYPIGVVIIFWTGLQKIEKAYRKWEQGLLRDVPEVIDYLRISFTVGRDYISAIRQASRSCNEAMEKALSRLVQDIEQHGANQALRHFSLHYDIPVMSKLTAAITLAVENGYESAEAYLIKIEEEVLLLRQEAMESLVETKPNQVVKLYILLFILAVTALLLKGWEIWQMISQLWI